MIPTQIDTAILLPGLRMPEVPPDGRTDAPISGLILDETDGFAWLENEAKVIYSVDRKKVIKIEDVKVDCGLLAERLFCLCRVSEVGASGGVGEFSRGWFSDFLSEDDFAFIEECNMEALYAVANGHFQGEIDDAKKGNPFAVADGEPVPDSNIIGEHRLFDQTFLGFWSVSSSQGYYDIAPEIDDISFEGEGRITLIETK